MGKAAVRDICRDPKVGESHIAWSDKRYKGTNAPAFVAFIDYLPGSIGCAFEFTSRLGIGGARLLFKVPFFLVFLILFSGDTC